MSGRRPDEHVGGTEEEEAKFEKQAKVAGQQLDTVRAAIKILQGGATAALSTSSPKRRVMSAEAKAKISKASKARWAKIRAAKGKTAKTK